MADYPTHAIARDGSSRRPLHYAQLDYTGDGQPRLRDFASVEGYEFEVAHPKLTQAEAEAITALWRANRTTPVRFTWPEDDVVYLVLFVEPPELRKEAGSRWTARVRLTGVAE